MSGPRTFVAAALGPALGALAVLLGIAAIFWLDLTPSERGALQAMLGPQRVALLLLLLVPALALLGWLRWREARGTHQAAARLAEATELIAHANPAHRVAESAAPQLRALARAIDELAAERSRLASDVQAAVAQARSGAEEERNRLAALLSEMDQSVLVCNRDGLILLYNEAASELLAPGSGNGGERAIGLGRSAFGVIDRDLILHAMERMQDGTARGERASVHFVTAGTGGRLLRVGFAPVFASARERSGAAPGDEALTGFVLLLADVTKNVESDARSVALLQQLVESSRAAIAGIRAAIETLIAHPDLDAQRRARFTQIVQTEAVRLSERLDNLNADVSARLRLSWPLEEMRGADLAELACRRIQRKKGLHAQPEAIDPRLWVRVDSFTLVQAVSSLAGRLNEEFAVREFRVRVQQAEDNARLDLAWKGVPMSSETAFHWQNDAFSLGGEDSPLSLSQVMERHGGEAWYQRDAPSQTNYFRLLLPLAPEPQAARPRPALANRPEFYDFDLFHRPADSGALGERRLVDLAYTVFDTETTGLEPSQGDEIISIGAARIVNGRLLRSETFETLVDPQRPISPASMAVHGITPDLLAGQPRITEVLPRFWRFSQDTVLVGHNAAFDMRFLQLKEGPTGVRFGQPVLDTLLLAAVVHPNAETQSLEDIAARFGIPILGRHTALGDALATAEVFLALIPLLAAQGVRTLAEALAASEKTYYARVRY